MDIATKSIRSLPNGKTLDDLIMRETREVSLAVMNDEELYQWELENLFGMGWNLLGHESEIPDANDYVVRPMGEDLVIVARDRQGQIHVSLNVCPHRGMHVCTAESAWRWVKRATRRPTNVSTTAGRSVPMATLLAPRWKKSRCTAACVPRRSWV